MILKILMTMPSKKVQFINCPEAEDVDAVTSKLITDGNALNVDWLCRKGNTCEVITNNAWAVVKFCPMYPKIWSSSEVKKEASNVNLKKKEMKKWKDPNEPKLKTTTSSNVSAANTFIAPWSKFAPIWPLTKNVQVQRGFATSVPKHSERKDHYVFILCKFIKLNLFVTNVPKTLVQITKSSFAICKEPTLQRKRKKIVCTNVQNVPDLSTTRKIWKDIWPNTKRELSEKETINKKKNSFATSAEKSMEITSPGSITSRVTALSTNAKLVLVDSKLLAVSNTTWLCTLVLLHSIAESAEKLLSLATNCYFIKSRGIQTSDHTRANGAEKVSCSRTNWPSIDAEYTPAKNHSNATCATRDSQIQVLYLIIANVTLVLFTKPHVSLRNKPLHRPMGNKPSLLRPVETRMKRSIPRMRPQQQQLR